jgi:hypothetical protein
LYSSFRWVETRSMMPRMRMSWEFSGRQRGVGLDRDNGNAAENGARGRAHTVWRGCHGWRPDSVLGGGMAKCVCVDELEGAVWVPDLRIRKNWEKKPW